jgi:peptidoglycan/xylan/chitin deacetylase (PgdA/CDA1 family)
LPKPVEPLDWREAERLLELGHGIGSHTCSHPDLVRLTPAGRDEELRASRAELERRLGIAVRHFSAPYGDAARFSPEVSSAAREAGYASCLSAQRGVNDAGADPFSLRRDHLMAHWPVADVRFFLSRS